MRLSSPARREERYSRSGACTASLGRVVASSGYPEAGPPPHPYYVSPYYRPPYPAAYYPPPPGYGVAAPDSRRLPYRQGDPIPPGYELRSEPRLTPLVIGLSATGGLWLITATIGMTAECLNSTDLPGEKKKDYSSLYIPAFGPFLAIGVGEPSNKTIAWLVADGVLQTAGLVTAVFAFAFP